MRNPFKQTLPADLTTQAFGGYENAQFVHSNVDELDPYVADVPKTLGQPFDLGPGINANDTSAPYYDQPYVWDGYPLTSNDASDINSHSVVPAPGSTDLIQPRSTGGITATQRSGQSSQGPVTGEGSLWNNQRAVLNVQTPGYKGPVGSMDYSQQLTRAYFQAEAQAYSAEASSAAMVASV